MADGSKKQKDYGLPPLTYAEAARILEVQRGIAFGGAIMPVVGLFSRSAVYRQCMEAKGYKSL